VQVPTAHCDGRAEHGCDFVARWTAHHWSSGPPSRWGLGQVAWIAMELIYLPEQSWLQAVNGTTGTEPLTHESLKGCGMDEKDRRACARRGAGGGNAVYGLGLIGALVYYIQQADGFWPAILGILKALVWPAFLTYDLLKFLGS